MKKLLLISLFCFVFSSCTENKQNIETVTISKASLERILFDAQCDRQNSIALLQSFTKLSDREIQERVLDVYNKRSIAYREIKDSLKFQQEFPIKWDKYRFCMLKSTQMYLRLLLETM